jgi:hypothetical protein
MRALEPKHAEARHGTQVMPFSTGMHACMHARSGAEAGRGMQVMPFSTGLSTTLSNFEAGLTYKDVADPSVMVAFPIVGDVDGAAFIAWTTTPWTLPSNLALCVHPEFTYVRVRDPATGAVFIVAESRLPFVPGAVPKKGKGKNKGVRSSNARGDGAARAARRYGGACGMQRRLWPRERAECCGGCRAEWRI